MTIDEAIDEIKRWTSILMESGNKCTMETAEVQNMAIESLKFQQEYQAKVQKCIERLVKRAEYFDMFYDDSGIRGCIDIINEELGGKGQ